MAEYDFWIETYPIHPPIGGKLAWGAKAKIKKIGSGKNENFLHLKSILERRKPKLN